MNAWLADSASWQQYGAAAGVIGGFATGLGILIGGLSLLFIWLQTRHSAKVSKEITAFEAHKDYIRLCIEYPQLSSSYMMKEHLGVDSFDGILQECSLKTEKALWFLSYVLFAQEQLLLTNRTLTGIDPAWRCTIEDQLGYHSELLRAVWPEWKSHYSDPMDAVVTRVLLRDAEAPPISE